MLSELNYRPENHTCKNHLSEARVRHKASAACLGSEGTPGQWYAK
jgi:hypothetical protein